MRLVSGKAPAGLTGTLYRNGPAHFKQPVVIHRHDYNQRMKSRWSEADASRNTNELALRAYSSRLLGSDATLVLHGELDYRVPVGQGLELYGVLTAKGVPAYVAAKHGVVGLTKTAAIEFAKKGIRVNAVCPGGIRTEMLERAIHEKPWVEKQLLRLQPIGRLGEPREIGEVVVFLCSDQASFLTGQAGPVDGGCTAI